MTEQLHFHFPLSCTGGGNGNPLQYSCLENPWDGGAWWAAIYGVTQSQTRLKRLSSSSSRNEYMDSLKGKCRNAHISFLHNSPNLKTTQTSVNTLRELNIRDVVIYSMDFLGGASGEESVFLWWHTTKQWKRTSGYR